MLRNIHGPDTDPTLDQILTQLLDNVWSFLLFYFLLKPLLYFVFSKKVPFVSPPKRNRNTVCEDNCANWTIGFVFLHIHLWGFCRVRFLFVLICSMLGMKHQKIETLTKRNQTTRSKQANNPVLCFEKRQRT